MYAVHFNKKSAIAKPCFNLEKHSNPKNTSKQISSPQKMYIPTLPTQPRTILSCHFLSSGDLGANHDCGNAVMAWYEK